MQEYGTFNIKLIKVGFNAFSIKKNTQLGKLIAECKKVHPNNIVWYKVNNLNETENFGNVTITYRKLV